MTLGPAMRARLVGSVLEGRASPNTDRALARDATGPGSLAAFVQQCWPILEPGTPLEWNWHLDIICRELESVTRGETKDLVICIPPGFAKSLLVSVLWPAWWWLHEPHKRFLTVASVEPLAIRDNGRMREVVESEWYQRLVAFMEEEHGIASWGMAHDQNQKRNFKNMPHQGVRQCFGVIGSPTGSRGDGLIIDDPHQVNDVLGAPDAVMEKMDAAWHRINVVIDSRVNDRRKRFRVVIQQRVHEHDVAGRILAQGKCRHVVLPMRHDPTHPYIHPDDPRTEPGELLDPVRAPEEEVVEQEERLDVLPGQKEAQLQQRPINASGGLFKSKYMRNRYDFDPQRPDTRFPFIAVTVDTTIKETKAGAFVSIQGWGVRGVERYLLDEIHRRMDLVDTEEALLGFCKKWKPNVTLVEEKATGSAVIRRLQAQIPGLVGFFPDTYGDKTTRAQLSLPAWAAGNVWLPSAEWCPWVQEYIAELLAFPKGATKDRVDAMSQLFLWLEENDLYGREALNDAVAGLLEDAGDDGDGFDVW